MLWEKILPQTSGSSNINPADRGRMFLRNVAIHQKHSYGVRTQNTTLWTITDKQTWNDRTFCTCFWVILQCCVMHKWVKCYTVVKAREGCLVIICLKAPSPHLPWVTHNVSPNVCSSDELWNRMSEAHCRIEGPKCLTFIYCVIFTMWLLLSTTGMALFPGLLDSGEYRSMVGKETNNTPKWWHNITVTWHNNGMWKVRIFTK
jgi:hypothetical protein